MPGMLQSTGLQRVRHDLTTEHNSGYNEKQSHSQRTNKMVTIGEKEGREAR